MPAGAYRSTECQLLDLLGAAAGGGVVEVRRHTLAGVPRPPETAARIAAEVATLDDLRADPPDLLLVTGSEPSTARIEDEPYWDELAGLLVWARERVSSLLLSCLAAHAALAAFDGLERTTLAAKCTGVFPQTVDRDHPLTAGFGAEVVLPHSRLNTVAAAGLREAGYRVAAEGPDGEWSVATGPAHAGRATTVVVQGHPEYGPTSLLREYHRDVRRYVTGERDVVPPLPVDCVHPDDRDGIAGLDRRLRSGERDPGLLDVFDFDGAADRVPWPWHDDAVHLYANWLAGVPGGAD
jgi:homoserine O-succinyltransferase